MTNPYRFNSKDHIHELSVNGEWKALTGTSSVLSIIAKPLVWWSSGLAVREFGVPDPKVLTKIRNKKASKQEIADLFLAANNKLCELRAMTPDDYLRLLDRAYRAHATNLKDTADEGTSLHDDLSRFVRWRMGIEEDRFFNPRIQPFIKWTDENVDRFLWSEMNCWSRTHWLGGISDCGFIDKQGKMGILDFKSSKEAYWSAFAQIAGYDLQITENGGFDADGNTILPVSGRPADYYAVLPFGMSEPQVSIRTDTQNLKDLFLHALALYGAFPRD